MWRKLVRAGTLQVWVAALRSLIMWPQRCLAQCGIDLFGSGCRGPLTMMRMRGCLSMGIPVLHGTVVHVLISVTGSIGMLRRTLRVVMLAPKSDTVLAWSWAFLGNSNNEMFLLSSPLDSLVRFPTFLWLMGQVPKNRCALSDPIPLPKKQLVVVLAVRPCDSCCGRDFTTRMVLRREERPLTMTIGDLSDLRRCLLRARMPNSD